MIDASLYGKALFELAAETGEDEMIGQQVREVAELLSAHPQYVTLLDTPALPAEEKLTLIRSAFGSADSRVRSTLCLLCEKHAVRAFGDCARAYVRCRDEARNLLRAEAVTAVPLTERQSEALRSRLSAMTGKSIELENRIDPSIISGITLRYGGVQLDDSIRSRLEALRRSLRETIV